MALCHECGSEVAGNDQFCPYCGIALQVDAAPQDDAAFESTIIMQPPAQASQTGTGSAASATANDPSSDLDDFNDVPTPIALQELERSAESSVQPSENFQPTTPPLEVAGESK